MPISVKSYNRGIFRRTMLSFFPILVLIPAHVRSAQSDLYRAELKTPFVSTLIAKRDLLRFSLITT